MALVKTKKDAFIIGLLASLCAVIVWDLIKHQYRILNYAERNNEAILPKV